MVTAGPASGTAARDVASPGHAMPELGPLASRPMPPVAHVAMAVMALVLAGGIYIAAYLPRRASLAPALALLGVAAVLLLANVVQLSRLRDFAWHTFWQVTGWASVAYLVIAGMIEFALVRDGTRGSMLVVMTALIVIFAVDIPMLLAFSIARYQEPRTNIRS